MIKLLLAVVAAFPALTAPSVDAVDLVWKPKTDQKTEYVITMDATAPDHTLKASVEMVMKIQKVNADGSYEYETTYSKNKVVADGTEHESPAPKPRVVKHDARGKRIRAAGEPEEPKTLMTMADFESPEKPVNVGDTWSRNLDADANTGRPAFKITSTFVGPEKFQGVDTWKVKVTAVQKGDSPQTVEAVYYLATEDGAMVRAEVDTEDPADSSKKMKMRATRKDLVKS
jgi:hypothetical protein